MVMMNERAVSCFWIYCKQCGFRTDEINTGCRMTCFCHGRPPRDAFFGTPGEVRRQVREFDDICGRPSCWTRLYCWLCSWEFEAVHTGGVREVGCPNCSEYVARLDERGRMVRPDPKAHKQDAHRQWDLIPLWERSPHSFSCSNRSCWNPRGTDGLCYHHFMEKFE